MRLLQKNCCRREWRGLSNFWRFAKDLQGTRKRPRIRGPTRRRSIRHICACPILPKSHRGRGFRVSGIVEQLWRQLELRLHRLISEPRQAFPSMAVTTESAADVVASDL